MSIPRLTKEQATIIGAFTGYTAGPFSDVQDYAEKLFGRARFTHEFASAEFAAELKEKSRDDFMALVFDPSE